MSSCPILSLPLSVCLSVRLSWPLNRDHITSYNCHCCYLINHNYFVLRQEKMDPYVLQCGVLVLVV